MGVEGMTKTEIDKFVIQIGERVRELRTERRMTQAELSAAAAGGMEESAIQRLEKGRSSPTAKTLYKIAKGLDVEMWEFFKEGFDK